MANTHEAADRLEEIIKIMKETLVNLKKIKDTPGVDIDNIIIINESIESLNKSIALNIKTVQYIRGTAE